MPPQAGACVQASVCSYARARTHAFIAAWVRACVCVGSSVCAFGGARARTMYSVDVCACAPHTCVWVRRYVCDARVRASLCVCTASLRACVCVRVWLESSDSVVVPCVLCTRFSRRGIKRVCVSACVYVCAPRRAFCPGATRRRRSFAAVDAVVAFFHLPCTRFHARLPVRFSSPSDIAAAAAAAAVTFACRRRLRVYHPVGRSPALRTTAAATSVAAATPCRLCHSCPACIRYVVLLFIILVRYLCLLDFAYCPFGDSSVCVLLFLPPEEKPPCTLSCPTAAACVLVVF